MASADGGSALTKREVLGALNFGARVAEEEHDDLADYFVETDQWQKVVTGQVDIVFGPKGSGKSAIYTSLMNRTADFAQRKIILVTAEKPRGSTVFRSLVVDPPIAEPEFTSIWKLYILSLLGTVIRDNSMTGANADRVRDALFKEGLLAASDVPLKTRFMGVWEWVKGAIQRAVPRGEISYDPLTATPTVAFQISLQEPSLQERSRGHQSLDDLLQIANDALADNGSVAWILFDRLDVAFAESHDLEASGVRALFKSYLDMRDLDQIGIKIFLRTDIWNEVTKTGFREASHITRQLRIEWGNESLLNLVVRRALRITEVSSYYALSPETVLGDVSAQRSFFDSMVPDQVDVGKNPATFEWILGGFRMAQKSRLHARSFISLMKRATRNRHS